MVEKRSIYVAENRETTGGIWKTSLKELNPGRQLRHPVRLPVYLAFVAVLLSCLKMGIGIGHVQAGSLSEGLPGSVFSYFVLVLLFVYVFLGAVVQTLSGEAERYQQVRPGEKAEQAQDMVLRLSDPERRSQGISVPAGSLKKGDYVCVKAGQIIPADGVVIKGTASVDESAITGESAPVIREADSVRSAVTGKTMVISDWLVIRITGAPGENYLDQAAHRAGIKSGVSTAAGWENGFGIWLVSGAILLLTLILFLFTPLLRQMKECNDLIWLICLAGTFAGLMPGAAIILWPAVTESSIRRLKENRVAVMDRRMLKTVGRVTVLIMDKTGTITLGNRKAGAFWPLSCVTAKELADAAQLASLADETPEGRSIVVLAKEKFGIRGRSMEELQAEFVPFSVNTRMSGINYQGNEIRKGAADRIRLYVESGGGFYSRECDALVHEVAGRGSTPLVVARNGLPLGVVELKDTLKEGVAEKCAGLRRMGIKTIMLTGDNPRTAAFLAAEAGVDDFVAEAPPERKLALVREYQAQGHLVAMTGDGDNDAPALAQADVAVVMGTGTAAAKEACNMIDLDSSPAKLLEIVRIGRQQLWAHHVLLTVSLAQTAAAVGCLAAAAAAGSFIRVPHIGAVILAVLLCQVVVILGCFPLVFRGIGCQERSGFKLYGKLLALFLVSTAVMMLFTAAAAYLIGMLF